MPEEAKVPPEAGAFVFVVVVVVVVVCLNMQYARASCCMLLGACALCDFKGQIYRRPFHFFAYQPSDLINRN